jgi:Lectin C-type domain
VLIKKEHADRLNASHFIDLKKNGSIYQASDGSTCQLFENVTDGYGDCVLFKNGSLTRASCEQSAYFVCENE